MEQNPNEETVDVNASPQQPEAKDTLETTDDMDSQASVKMEGSTEADTSASQEKEAVPVETALETEPAQDTEKAPVDADTKAEATENDTDEEKTSATTEVSDTAAAKTEAGAEGMPSDFNTAENASADTAVSEEAIPAENSPKASLENASSEDETFSEQAVQEPVSAEAVDTDILNGKAFPAEDSPEASLEEDVASEDEPLSEQAVQEPVSAAAVETDILNEEAIPAEDTPEASLEEDVASEDEPLSEQAVQEPVSAEAVNTDILNEEMLVSEDAEEADSANRKKKPEKNKGKLSRGRKIVNGIIIAFLTIALLGSGTGAYLLYHIAHKADPDGMVEKMKSDEPSVFYASDGKTIIGELGEESRENITYEQVPQSTIDAFLAIEDSRFYSHNGFDLPRFISSAFNNMKSGDLSQGGSTLTMQTVDNFIMKPVEDKMQKEGKYFSTKEKIERKIQEIYLSMCLDDELSKEDIMTRYLNQINFGQHTRGIQKGAQYYFGKNVEDLNLSESAFLAGVINAPNSNNPYNGIIDGDNYYQQAMKRRDETLYQMLNHGYITETEYKLAKATKLAFQVAGEPDAAELDPYKDYVRAAADEIIDKYGVDPATTPMKVYTALDINAQKAANKASSGKVVGLTDNKYYQIGFTVLNNKNGEVIAVSAGRTDIKSADGQVHFRFREPHQPGSSIKPIFDYAPSFDKIGYCTSRVFVDKAISFGNWNVINANGSYNGKVSMERAIAQSLNTPAVQTFDALLNRVGYDEMISYAKKTGFDPDVAKNMDIQYSIGASGMMDSPTEMAAAYATLANGGTYNEAHMVRKIVYKNEDKTIKAKVQTHQPLSPQAAYMTSDLLYRAIFGKDSGWNLMSRLGFGAYPVYGKTGTSDWADDAWKYGGPMKDEWMINYTSEYTIATWSGFDSGIEGKPTYISEEILNANIPGWINKYMLDSIATGNEHMISSPGGISSYGGGMIKSEWLATAKQNNPLTIANSKTNNKALKSAVSSAKGMKSSDYTAETYSKLQAAIAAAEKILKDDMAPQEDIDKAKADLQAALNGLVSSANKSSLNAALTKAAGINTSLYTPESIHALNAAVNSAKSVYDNKKSTQAQIDAQTSAVNNAINTLVQKPVISRDALNEAINKGNAINRNSYTVESILQFESILNVAKTVYGDANATQAQIDEQTAKVNAALTEVLKPAQ